MVYQTSSLNAATRAMGELPTPPKTASRGAQVPATIPDGARPMSESEMIAKFTKDAEVAWKASDEYHQLTRAYNIVDGIVNAIADADREADKDADKDTKAKDADKDANAKDANAKATDAKETDAKETDASKDANANANATGSRGGKKTDKGRAVPDKMKEKWDDAWVEVLRTKDDRQKSFVTEKVNLWLLEDRLRKAEESIEMWQHKYEAKQCNEVPEGHVVLPPHTTDSLATPASAIQTLADLTSVKDNQNDNQQGVSATSDENAAIGLAASEVSPLANPFLLSTVPHHVVATPPPFALVAPPLPVDSPDFVDSPVRRRRWASADGLCSGRANEASAVAGVTLRVFRTSAAARPPNLQRMIAERTLEMQRASDHVESNDTGNTVEPAAPPSAPTPPARERYPSFATPNTRCESSFISGSQNRTAGSGTRQRNRTLTTDRHPRFISPAV